MTNYEYIAGTPEKMARFIKRMCDSNKDCEANGITCPMYQACADYDLDDADYYPGFNLSEQNVFEWLQEESE